MIEYWGLDIETSGTDPDTSALIQIGVAAPDGATFSAFVSWRDWTDTSDNPRAFHWSLEAEAVHGISRAHLEEVGHPSFLVDADLVSFIGEHTTTDRARRRIPVGWNVGSFDMQFVRKYLPGTARMLSYRSFDLNSAVMLLVDAGFMEYDEMKAKAKQYAADTLGEEDWHDALFDARAGLLAKQFLEGLLRGDKK